ncbi:MAG: permease-like cell division protein FtsX, partial [Burkholderiaceae bacterium]|nr:permease-like cell division protein FtsX [Burkholderiaceae bacterium]
MNAGAGRADLWGRAWRALVARPGRSLLAVLAAAVALAPLLLLVALASAILPHVGRLPVAEATAFVAAGTAAADVKKLAGQIAALDGVRDVRTLDRETALAQLQRRLPQASATKSNPLPDALVVEFQVATPAAAVEAAAAAMRKLPLVESVVVDVGWYRRYLAIGAHVLTASGLTLGALSLLALIVALGAAAALTTPDATEIALLDMLGARPGFARGPHVLAGALGMLAAAGLSIGLFALLRWG